jgi:radical SAM superfamily enzyme YgiQ (UPF0313 family)
MKRVLLVNPLIEAVFAPQFVNVPGRGKMGILPPLGLATIAALTSDDIEVDLWDEAVNGRIETSTDLKDYDLVGLTGYRAHLSRANEIGRIFRQRGVLTAIGGAGVSADPERCTDTFDILFLGEAELTWPRFLAEWKTGHYRKVYRQITKPSLALSPPPRWDGLNMNAYLLGVVQTMRGCPFDCEFCDVVHLFGRGARHKPIDLILEEIRTLERLGMREIVFCDDNFIGVRRFAKDLLRELVALNRSFRYPMSFEAQLSINVAKDDEMLELFADANFRAFLIGIESPNKESLKEANKLQNYRTDLLADIKKIQSYGLVVTATMIVGFDHDDTNIFDEHFQFLQEACIPRFGVYALKAPSGTRLWTRLCKEGRLVQYEEDQSRYFEPCGTNIIPKQMTRVELYAGYRSLMERLYDWDNFAVRVKGMISGIKRQPHVPQKRRGTWRDVIAFVGYVLSYPDRKALRATFSILWHILRHAPFMLHRVGTIIAMYYREVYHMLVPLCEAIQRQIELETSDDFQLEMVQDCIVFPEPFIEFYEGIFPEIHQRAYQRLTDKTRTNDVLIAVFAEFVAQEGGSFEQALSTTWKERHKTFLYDLCDRTVARENSECHSSAVPLQGDEEPDLEGTDLVEGILQGVEQELRSEWRAI